MNIRYNPHPFLVGGPKRERGFKYYIRYSPHPFLVGGPRRERPVLSPEP